MIGLVASAFDKWCSSVPLSSNGRKEAPAQNQEQLARMSALSGNAAAIATFL